MVIIFLLKCSELIVVYNGNNEVHNEYFKVQSRTLFGLLQVVTVHCCFLKAEVSGFEESMC